MTATHRNRLVTTVSAVAAAGLGAFTVSTASSGYRTFVAGDDGLTFDGILITEGTTWEVRNGCVYTHAGTSLARGTLMDSSTGSAITFTAAAVVQQGGSADLANKTEFLMGAFGLDPIAVTAATTATIGRMHLCTGTTADYTVTLPAASGNAGKLIGFRMGTTASLTKLITLDGNASETIDGSLTRIMWSNEAAILLCDGSNWFKVAGKTVPMVCHLSKTATFTITDSTISSTTYPTKDFGTDLMHDTGNGRIKIVRPGFYNITSFFYCAGSSSIGVLYASASVNSGTAFTPYNAYAVSPGYSAVGAAAWAHSYNLAANDYVVGTVYVIGVGTLTVGAAPTLLGAEEIPSW